jgi:hypothetical protein
MLGEYKNDMWATLSKGVEAITNYKLAKMIATKGSPVQSTSSPNGSLGSSTWNPLPGFASAFPQADGKGSSAVVPAGSIFANPLLLIAGALLALLILLRFGR